MRPEWALFVCIVVNPRQSDNYRLSDIKCLVNFFGAQRCLIVNNFVSFTFRSITAGLLETGVALIDEDWFFGWVLKSQNKDVLEKKLSNEKIFGIISCVKMFNWVTKGEICYCEKVIITMFFSWKQLFVSFQTWIAVNYKCFWASYQFENILI